MENELRPCRHCPFYEPSTRNVTTFCLAYNKKGCWADTTFSSCEVWAIISDKRYLLNAKPSEVAHFLHNETTSQERISMDRQGGVVSGYFLEECEKAKEKGSEKWVKYTK